MTSPSPTIQYQREFYEERWAGASFANRLKLSRCAVILDAVVSTRVKEPKMVDLGCGSGWLAGILGNFGPTVAVDLSSTATSEASKKYPHIEFVTADIFDWRPNVRFDVVVSQEVIEHVADQSAYLGIAHRLLREGGYLILTTPNAATLHAMPEPVRAGWSRQPIENWLTRTQLKDLLEERFDVMRLTSLIAGYGTRGSYRFANSNHLRALFEIFDLAETFDRVRLKLGFGLHTLAVARKR